MLYKLCRLFNGQDQQGQLEHRQNADKHEYGGSLLNKLVSNVYNELCFKNCHLQFSINHATDHAVNNVLTRCPNNSRSLWFPIRQRKMFFTQLSIPKAGHSTGMVGEAAARQTFAWPNYTPDFQFPYQAKDFLAFLDFHNMKKHLFSHFWEHKQTNSLRRHLGGHNNQCIRGWGTCRIQNPDIRTTDSSGRGARRGGAGQTGPPTEHFAQETSVPRTLQGTETQTRLLNVSPEERTSEIVCKPMAEHNERLTTG